MSDENFVRESLHLQAVVLDKSNEICDGDENFVRHCLSDEYSIKIRGLPKL